jgi:hypothetical protein
MIWTLSEEEGKEKNSNEGEQFFAKKLQLVKMEI